MRKDRLSDDVNEMTAYTQSFEAEFADLMLGDGEGDLDAPPEGDRWSTWDLTMKGQRGPRPFPSWVVTASGAVDAELGMLKTGKEADVHLLRRYVPGTPGTLLAAKRYRDTDHRMFRRDAGYLEGRRMRASREMRAMSRRTSFGRQVIAGQWANAEFGALCRMYELGVAVPYPVQIHGTELLMEFIGSADGTAAPRLAQLRSGAPELPDLWDQLVEMTVTLAQQGMAHGDLSPYNLLVHDGRLVMIDMPQVVDVIGNPQGREFLQRDATNVATWFAARGHHAADGAALGSLLATEARLD